MENKQTPKLKMLPEYSRLSVMQQNVLKVIQEEQLPLILQKFPLSTLQSPDSFFIADYGCATGHNSILVFKLILTHVFEKNPNKEIIIFINDLLQNDFSLALENVQNELKNEFPDKDIFVFASGMDFYHQCLPTNKIHIALCSNSVHWINKWPGKLPNNQYYCSPDRVNDQECINPWKETADENWNQFLQYRQKELAEDGFLIVTMLTSKTFEIQNKVLAENINKLLLENDMKELIGFVQPNIYLRSQDEILNPFQKGSEKVKNLKVTHFNIKEVCPLNQTVEFLDEKVKLFFDMIKSVQSETLRHRIHSLAKDFKNLEIDDQVVTKMLNQLYKDSCSQIQKTIQYESQFSQSYYAFLITRKTKSDC